MPRRQGFTLVELVLVIVILGVIASVGAPRFFAKRDFDAHFYSEDVLGALRFGQRLAVASGCPVEIRFTGSDYTLAQRTGCQTGAFALAVTNPGTGAASYAGQAPTGTAVVPSANPIVFDALGRALVGGVVTDATVGVAGRSFQIAGETGFAWDPAL